MTASEKTWEACRIEILSLLDEIDAASAKTQSTERLLQILYGHGGYDKLSVDRALKNLDSRLLLKIDAAERSIFCGTR
ncbi:MAG: hypothetical protein WBZ42_04965 [Halobacteriota archaeon]